MSSPLTITALALVVASFDAYFGLARNVRSPGPASSIFATRRISMAASPSMGHSKRRANSPSVTKSRISLARLLHRRRHPFDEQRHFRHVQAPRDLFDQPMARVGIERKGMTQIGERRVRRHRPGHAIQRVDG